MVVSGSSQSLLENTFVLFRKLLSEKLGIPALYTPCPPLYLRVGQTFARKAFILVMSKNAHVIPTNSVILNTAISEVCSTLETLVPAPDTFCELEMRRRKQARRARGGRGRYFGSDEPGPNHQWQIHTSWIQGHPHPHPHLISGQC